MGLDFAVTGRHPDVLRGVDWISGARIQKTLPSPIEIMLDEDDSGPDMPDYFGSTLPVCSDKIINVLKVMGVNNIDLYDVVLLNPVTGKSYLNYKLVNVLDRVAAADMDKSTYDSRSEMYFIEFDKLVIDSQKAQGLDIFRLGENDLRLIISELLKEALEREGLLGASFQSLEWT